MIFDLYLEAGMFLWKTRSPGLCHVYGGHRSCVIILLFVLLLWGMTTQNRLARISILCLCHGRAGFTGGNRHTQLAHTDCVDLAT